MRHYIEHSLILFDCIYKFGTEAPTRLLNGVRFVNAEQGQKTPTCERQKNVSIPGGINGEGIGGNKKDDGVVFQLIPRER